MCIPFFRAPAIPVEGKAKAYLTVLRIACCLQFVLAVLFFCAFRWIDGVTSLLFAVSGILTLFVGTSYGMYLLTVICYQVMCVSITIWAAVRILLFHVARSQAVGPDYVKLKPWQKDTLQAAIYMDLVIALTLAIFSTLLFLALRAHFFSDPANADDDPYFGWSRGPGYGGGGYMPVSSQDSGYLHSGPRGRDGGSDSARYNFGSNRGYTLGGNNQNNEEATA